MTIRDFSQINLNLKYNDGEGIQDIDPDIYENFGTIDTCADGNCFFHGCVNITTAYSKARSRKLEGTFVRKLREKVAKTVNVNDDFDFIKNDLMLPPEDNPDETVVITKFKDFYGNEDIIDDFTDKDVSRSAIKTVVEILDYDDDFYDNLNTKISMSMFEDKDATASSTKEMIIDVLCNNFESEFEGKIDKGKMPQLKRLYKKYLTFLLDKIMNEILDEIKDRIREGGNFIDMEKDTSQATLSQKYLQKILNSNIVVIQHVNDSTTVHALCDEFDKERNTIILLGDFNHFERVVRKNPDGKVRYTSVFGFDTPFIEKLYEISCINN